MLEVSYKTYEMGNVTLIHSHFNQLLIYGRLSCTLSMPQNRVTDVHRAAHEAGRGSDVLIMLFDVFSYSLLYLMYPPSYVICPAFVQHETSMEVCKCVTIV
jgi:hypothetical protein